MRLFHKAIAALILSVTVTAVIALPAEAACKRYGFTVNDYGKDGPTRDAKALLDKLISQKMADLGVTKYSTGKKDVKCELFLNFIVFDEHTCTAEATVCWGGSETTGGEAENSSAVTDDANEPKKAAAKPATKPKAPVKAEAESADAPKNAKAEPAAKSEEPVNAATTGTAASENSETASQKEVTTPAAAETATAPASEQKAATQKAAEHEATSSPTETGSVNAIPEPEAAPPMPARDESSEDDGVSESSGKPPVPPSMAPVAPAMNP